MDPIVVVGSGASGVHFALTALRKGRRVIMLDAGHTAQEAVLPGETLVGLKRKLPDPALYFLGPRYESLVLPGSEGEYYAFPPSKEHVFRPRPEFHVRGDGFSPLYSFAAGGLAEAWTGGCYPFNDHDLSKFPFGYQELGPYYARVAAEIGISGAKDDMAAVFPYHDGLMEPLDLDEHSAVLLDSYRRRRSLLNGKLHCLMGRARVAVLSRDRGLAQRVRLFRALSVGMSQPGLLYAVNHAGRVPHLTGLRVLPGPLGGSLPRGQRRPDFGRGGVGARWANPRVRR